MRVLSRLATLIGLALILAPTTMLMLSWGSDQSEIWRHLSDSLLARLLHNMATLLVSVACITTVLGVSLAWLVTHYEFPGRRAIELVLALPLAMPAYVLSFTVLGFLELHSPLQQWLSTWAPASWHHFDPRSPTMVALVLSGAFYPYIYLLTRSAFLNQNRCLHEVAASLGVSKARVFFRVTLPLARPAIIAGLTLALMETLADFGAAATFNYDTFTTAIYRVWLGYFNLAAAAQLSSLLLLVVALLLIGERLGRGHARYGAPSAAARRQRIQLPPLKATLACIATSLPALIFFVLPVMQLSAWSWNMADSFVGAHYLQLMTSSFYLAITSSAFTVALCALIMISHRWQEPTRHKLNLTGSAIFALKLGYALPGSILAIGMMVALTTMSRTLQSLGIEVALSSGIIAMLMAYTARFSTTSINSIEASMHTLRPALTEAAQSLGAPSKMTLKRIFLPLLAPGIISAAIIVFVEVIKEMPASLLLRPFGVNTLATNIFEMTSEGLWEHAAPAALLIIALSMIPAVLIFKRV